MIARTITSPIATTMMATMIGDMRGLRGDHYRLAPEGASRTRSFLRQQRRLDQAQLELRAPRPGGGDPARGQQLADAAVARDLQRPAAAVDASQQQRIAAIPAGTIASAFEQSMIMP